jgi:hypothetical protein
LFIGRAMRRDAMRRYRMIANYLIAIALAMIGWLRLIVWDRTSTYLIRSRRLGQ